MRTVATGVARHPDGRLLPWPIQCPELGAITGASGHRTRRNLQKRRYHPADNNILLVGAFVVCRARAPVHRASVFRPNHNDNATPTMRLHVEDTLCPSDAQGSKKIGLASPIISHRASSDCPNPIFARTHSVYHTVLDHSSARSALTVLPTNSGDRGVLLVASLDECRWRADCSEAKSGLGSRPKYTPEEALVYYLGTCQ